MKYLYKGYLLACLILFSYGSYCQQKMQKKKDIYLICKNDNEFLGKPLHVLLDEINPLIKMVIVEGGWRERSPHISFFFMPRNEYQKCINMNKSPIRITVFLRDIFEWSMEKRTKAYYWEWTNQDKENLGYNIVTLISVSGFYDQCDN